MSLLSSSLYVISRESDTVALKPLLSVVHPYLNTISTLDHLPSTVINHTRLGSIASISYQTVPALLQAPVTVLLQQWQIIYERGKAIAPSLAMFSFINFAYLSYRHYGHVVNNVIVVGNPTQMGLSSSSSSMMMSRSSKWIHFALAGLTTLAIVPYTLLLMGDVNADLYARAEQTRGNSGAAQKENRAITKRVDVRDENGRDDDEDDEGKGKGERESQVRINEASTKQLLDSWATLNLGRSLLPLTGAVWGAWTAFST